MHQINKKMKTVLAILLLTLSTQSYSQVKIEEKTIQNFYTICKAQNYSAFNHQMVGVSRFDWRQYNRAVKRFKKSLEKDSTLCDSWYLIGYSYQKLNEFEKSIESCKKSIEMNQDSYSAYIIMGYSSIFLNDTISALKSFQSAKLVFPEKIDSYYGIALIKYWQKDFIRVRNEFAQFEILKNEDALKKDIETFKNLIDKTE